MNQKNKIVLTGGCGFIGSHTCVELQEAGYEVVILDNLSNSEASVVDGIERITHVRPTFYEVDCTNRAAVFDIFRKEGPIAGIIHFAASKAVGESVEKPLLYYRNNLTSLITMLEAAEQFGLKGFVFSSSCTVYGEPDPGRNPVDETAPIKPATSPYGNTKQIAEDIIRDNTNAGAHFKSIILRYFNPIGAHPSAEIGELPRGVPQNLLPYVCQTAMGIRKELSVFGTDYNTPDGSCIRDYINVVDLAKAHVKALDRMVEGRSEAPVEYFNLGTGSGVSVLELIHTFEDATGVRVPYKIVGRRAGDIEQIWGCVDKANKVLGWKAEKSLAETLAAAWKWQQRLRERGVM
jgi:UDP-glucose 4-epimerase